MDILLKRVTTPEEESQAGLSGGLLEEDVAMPGDHSSMCVSASEHLPVGHDVEGEDSHTDDPGLVFCVLVFNNKKSLKRKNN